jgi:tetratricopeptide (TPR) repeat protein
MNTKNEQDAHERTALEQEYLDQLPQICMAADGDLAGALAALDRYLAQAPPRTLKKRLLTWKGLFYLEHEKYDDAVRELRAADAIDDAEELATFNTKFELAKALELGGDPEEAYAVLVAAMDEIDAPGLHLDLLRALAQVSPSAGLPLPVGAEAAFHRVKHHHGIDEPASADLASEIVRVADLVHDASVRCTFLHDALREAESQPQKVALIEEYLGEVTVPYYRRLAEDLLHRLLAEDEPTT